MEIQLSEIKTRYGMLSVPNAGGDVIGRHLARYGEWAWDEVCFIAGILPSEGARVLDVGAFIGTFGIGLSQLQKLKSLCFVEANTNIMPLLKRNVQRIFTENDRSSRANRQLKPTIIEALVGPPGAPLLPGISLLNNLGSTAFTQFTSDEAIIVAPPPMRALTLADLRAEYGDFDLIKLDAEGMELEILRSDAQALSQGNTTLWIECNENPRSLEIMNLLASWELDVYYFAFPAHNPDNIYNDPVPIFPFAYETGLLVAPRVHPALNNTLQAHHCILQPVASARGLKDALWHTPRWGMREWFGSTPEGIAALACRSIKGETYESYLQPNASILKMQTDAAEDQRQELRYNFEIQGQHEANAKNAASDHSEYRHRHSAEAGEKLAWNSIRVLDLLAQMETARVQISDYEGRLSSLSARLEESQNAEALASSRLAMLEAEHKRLAGAEKLLGQNSARILDFLFQLEKAQGQTLDFENWLSSFTAKMEECRKAEALASDYLAKLETEREHSAELEESLASSSARTLDLLGLLEKAQEQKLDCGNELSSVSAKLDDTSAKLEISFVELKNVSTELEERRKEVFDYRNRAFAMENSLSWKITKPLREGIGRNSSLGRRFRSSKPKVSHSPDRFK
jgi:hypothetical protein